MYSRHYERPAALRGCPRGQCRCSGPRKLPCRRRIPTRSPHAIAPFILREPLDEREGRLLRLRTGVPGNGPLTSRGLPRPRRHIEIVPPRRDLPVRELEYAHHGKLHVLPAQRELVHALGEHGAILALSDIQDNELDRLRRLQEHIEDNLDPGLPQHRWQRHVVVDSVLREEGEDLFRVPATECLAEAADSFEICGCQNSSSTALTRRQRPSPTPHRAPGASCPHAPSVPPVRSRLTAARPSPRRLRSRSP